MFNGLHVSSGLGVVTTSFMKYKITSLGFDERFYDVEVRCSPFGSKGSPNNFGEAAPAFPRWDRRARTNPKERRADRGTLKWTA